MSKHQTKSQKRASRRNHIKKVNVWAPGWCQHCGVYMTAERRVSSHWCSQHCWERDMEHSK